FFALHAKTAVYDGGAPAKVTPSTASRLWVSGQKLEIPPSFDPAGLFFMAVLLVFGLYLRRDPGLQASLVTPRPRDFLLRHLHRFLRPPPVRE
ncbi:MAG TPA: hypothetical protein VL240_05740, partial [Candidatus Binatia bacterium]|nr:hypothetical protein [Candidatus Binatia bacterium]